MDRTRALRAGTAVALAAGGYVTGIAASPAAGAAALPPVVARQVAEINQTGDSNPASFATMGATTYFDATDAAAAGRSTCECRTTAT